MADKYAARTYVNPERRGRGRFVVSEGVAPSEKIIPDIGLPTLFVDPVHKEFFECVMVKGTIFSVYQKTYANAKKEYVATPSKGSAGCELNRVILTDATGAITYVAPATAAGAGETDLGLKYCPKGLRAGADAAAKLDGVLSKPAGVLAMDAYRPFQYGENEGVTFITHGYVEWPLVKKVDLKAAGAGDDVVVFDNTDLAVGDYVKSDAMGRPVRWVPGVDPDFLRVGHVIARDDLLGAAANYDYGFLQYMQLPYDSFEAALLNTVYESNVIDTSDDSVSKIFGVKPNINALLDLTDTATTVAGVVGAVRVNLVNL